MTLKVEQVLLYVRRVKDVSRYSMPGNRRLTRYAPLFLVCLCAHVLTHIQVLQEHIPKLACYYAQAR